MNKCMSLLAAGLTWALATNLSAAQLQLTENEQRYLDTKPVLSMCVDPDWQPYEKLDSQGQYTGLVASYMQLMQERIGKSIQPKVTADWAESQKRYEAGECDLVAALNKTPQRQAFLDFTQPYIQSPAVLVLLDRNMDAAKLADLGGQKLAMVKGYVYEAKLHEQYPKIQINYVENMEKALQAVADGNMDATIGPLFLVSAATIKLNLGNLKMVGNTEYKDELRVGVRKGDAVLLGIMEKAVASLTAEDHRSVRKSWAAH